MLWAKKEGGAMTTEDLQRFGYIREPSCEGCDQPNSKCTCDDGDELGG